MLSDALPEEVIRLDIDRETGNAIVMTESEKNYFGANIHTILADGFFLRFTIGEDSRLFLQQALRRLQEAANRPNGPSESDWQSIAAFKGFLPYIGDDLIRRVFELELAEFEKNGGQ